MKFDLTRPCGSCPFRTDVHPFIDSERVIEVLGDPDGERRARWPAVSFICHKTIDYDKEFADDDDGGRRIATSPGNQHCAGAAIILIRDDIPNDAMQLAERLLGWNPSKMDMTAPVYASRRACIEAHRKADRR